MVGFWLTHNLQRTGFPIGRSIYILTHVINTLQLTFVLNFDHICLLMFSLAATGASKDTWTCICGSGFPEVAASNLSTSCFTACNCTSGITFEWWVLICLEGTMLHYDSCLIEQILLVWVGIFTWVLFCCILQGFQDSWIHRRSIFPLKFLSSFC